MEYPSESISRGKTYILLVKKKPWSMGRNLLSLHIPLKPSAALCLASAYPLSLLSPYFDFSPPYVCFGLRRTLRELLTFGQGLELCCYGMRANCKLVDAKEKYLRAILNKEVSASEI